MVSRAHQVFDASGNMVDEKVRTQLREYVNGFAAFAAEAQSTKAGRWSSPP